MSQAGPNAPLNKGSSSHYDSSVQQATSAWSAAGIPKSKLVIGVPFYGTVLKTSRAITSSTGLYVKLANPSAIKGDQYDSLSADPCPGAKKSYSGEYQWRSVVSAGILSNKNGWKTYWDKTSATPYASQSSQKKFLSFDDPTSIKDKVAFVNSHSLGGAMIWSLEMDDSKHTLLSSLQGVRK
jgi:chitinase